MSAGERGLLCWGGNSQGDRCRGLGPALGLRGLDLSSILSGAPGRAEEESWRREKRRARGERRERLTWNCQEAERGVGQAGNSGAVMVPVDIMNGAAETLPPTQINTHWPVGLAELRSKEEA